MENGKWRDATRGQYVANLLEIYAHSHSLLSSGQVFYNWKGQLRTRAKKLKQIQDGKTGVDDKLALQKLTDVEKRALKLWKEDFQDKDIASVRSEGRQRISFFPLFFASSVCVHIHSVCLSISLFTRCRGLFHFSSLSLFRTFHSLSLSPVYKKTHSALCAHEKEERKNSKIMNSFSSSLYIILFEANTAPAVSARRAGRERESEEEENLKFILWNCSLAPLMLTSSSCLSTRSPLFSPFRDTHLCAQAIRMSKRSV